MSRTHPGNMLQFVDGLMQVQHQHHTDVQRLWRRVTQNSGDAAPARAADSEPSPVHMVLLQGPLYRGVTALALIDQALVTVHSSVWGGYAFSGDTVLVTRINALWQAVGSGATYIRGDWEGEALTVDGHEVPVANPWEAPSGEVGADWDARANCFVINDWACEEED